MYYDVLTNLDNVVVDEDDTNFDPGNENGTYGDMAVETYFLVQRDGEVADADLCRGINKLKDKNIYLGLKLDCEEFPSHDP